MVNTGRGRGRGRGGGTARGRGGGRGGSKKLSLPATSAPIAGVPVKQATASISRSTARLSASTTPAPSTRARLSTTPTAATAAGPSASKLRLNFTLSRAGSDAERTPSNPPAFKDKTSSEHEEVDLEHMATLPEDNEVDAEHDSEDELLTQTLDTTARRSGRAVKKVRHEDYDYGSEDLQAADQDYKQEQGESSQPPEVQILQVAEPTTKKRGRPSKTAVEATHQVAEGDQVSSSPVPSSTVIQDIHDLQVDPKIFEIMDHLKSFPNIVTELPELYDKGESMRVTPYTGTQLMHIYLTAHKLQLFNICDLVTDTWIRAFHTQRHRDARTNPFNGLWRRNRVLEKRLLRFLDARKAGRVPDEPAEFERDAPDYNLSAQDPSLDSDVLSFDSTLLGELYAHTPSTCGARRVWSDAMALAGDKAARMFVNTTHRGFVWAQELKDDVMKTSLRMLRRKITLKIEESSEGAWCERYHEHGPEGICYREAAASSLGREKEGGEEVQVEANTGWSSDEDSDGMEEMIRRGLEEDEDDDEDEEGREPKRRRL